ncbi:MAG: type II toxin-antitoxin system VapC family toxin [bacterium]|nr:type II toxin-antitoxin system VapC family toxin [bacterium]
MYLFDTDTLSNVVKRKPSGRLLQKLEETPIAFQHTSAINVGEIYYGASRSSRKAQILKAFKEMVFPNVNILPFDRQSGQVFGILKADLEKSGIGCSEPDLRIAAVAIQHSLILITGNTRHFKNIPGLRIEDWIT